MRGPAIEREELVEIQETLQQLAQPVSKAYLAQEITKLLNSFGGKVDRIELAQRLAAELAPRFMHKSNRLQKLIKYRPQELAALTQSAFIDEVHKEIMPMLMARKKTRAKIRTEEERLRRNKRAKNRYERHKRSYVRTPGAIERDFSIRSALLSLHPDPPTGPCLDEIFHGGRYKMCGSIDSLQWLFGLGRKRLVMAGPPIREGREIFYNYRGVLACMDALLKQTGSNAYWLPDPDRRKIILTGVLFRARKEATPQIRKAFEETLHPFLN